MHQAVKDPAMTPALAQAATLEQQQQQRRL
jgi:hypothetical protein